MLYFLRDADSGSPIREAWHAMMRSHPREMMRLFARIERIEAAKDKQAVAAADRIQPDLYYFSIGNVYVIYSLDGDGLVILSVGEASDAAERRRVIEDATQRLSVA